MEGKVISRYQANTSIGIKVVDTRKWKPGVYTILSPLLVSSPTKIHINNRSSISFKGILTKGGWVNSSNGMQIIDINDWKTGIYIVSLKDNGNIIGSEKFTKY